VNTVGATNPIAFIILGICFMNFQDLALWGATELFRSELNSGQVDYTFTCPIPRYNYIFSNMAGLAVRQLIYFLPIFAVGIWFSRETLSLSGFRLGFAAVLLSVAALSQMGACFGAMVLRFQQITSVFTFFNLAFQVFTGMFIPLHVFPAWVKWIGLLAFPQSAGMDLLRYYVAGTNPVVSVYTEWAILAGQFVVLGGLALLVVKRLERSARERGLHYI
jgi:ABC-type uncharacterized transport system permease subunit